MLMVFLYHFRDVMFIFTGKIRAQHKLGRVYGCMILQTSKPVANSDRSAHSLVKLLLVSTGILIALICQGCGETGRVSDDPAEPMFTIEGKTIRLENGVFAGEDGTVSLAASTHGELNNDGHEDLAAVLVLDSKGSGVFYYLNVLLSTSAGDWRSAGEVFLGDRIDFDFITIYAEGSTAPHTDVPIYPDDYGLIVVGFSMHAAGQAFADQPELYVTREWRVVGDSIVSTR
jgi:hypothetical protein